MERMVLEHYGCPNPGRLTVRQFFARVDKIGRLRRKLAGERETLEEQIQNATELGYTDESP